MDDGSHPAPDFSGDPPALPPELAKAARYMIGADQAHVAAVLGRTERTVRAWEASGGDLLVRWALVGLIYATGHPMQAAQLVPVQELEDFNRSTRGISPNMKPYSRAIDQASLGI